MVVAGSVPGAVRQGSKTRAAVRRSTATADRGQRVGQIERLLLAVLLFSCGMPLLAQDVPYSGRPRYSEGRLSLTPMLGLAKYNGEFSDEQVGELFGLQATYTLNRYLRLGLQAEMGCTVLQPAVAEEHADGVRDTVRG
jgi:hypothetical protein